MKKTLLVYCSYPYSENPAERTEEIKKIAKEIYREHRGELVLLIPHLVFDALYDYPPCAMPHLPDIALLELATIWHCDVFAYDPKRMSTGVAWEKGFAEIMGKPIFTYKQLLAGDYFPLLINVTHAVFLRRTRKTTKVYRFEKSEQVADRLTEIAATGKKYDRGKPMFDLLVPEFLEGLAKVLTMGAEKYGPENWKHGLEPRRFLAALYRHLNAYHRGEKNDSESGLSHLLHISINAMFLYYFDEVEKNVKDS